MMRTTCKLRFRWQSTRLPAPGQFLKSPRGRTAYEIVEIKNPSRGPMGSWRGTFVVCRWQPSEVPAEATVHPWSWDKR